MFEKETKLLRDVAEIIPGITITKDMLAYEGLRYYTSDVIAGKPPIDSKKFIREDLLDDLSKYLLQPGDHLVTVVNGERRFLGVNKTSNHPIAANETFIVRPLTISSRFISKYLRDFCNCFKTYYPGDELSVEIIGNIPIDVYDEETINCILNPELIPEEERSEFAFKIGLDLGFPDITADELKSWFIKAGWDADKFVTFRKINNGMRCAQLGYKFDNGCRVVIEYLSDLSIYTPDWFLSYDYDNSMYGNYYYIVVIGGIVADVYKSRSTKHLWLKRIPTINEITDFWKDK